MCSCCHAAALLDYSLGSMAAARFRLSRGREQTAATPTVLHGLGLTGLYLLDTTPQRHSGKARSFFFFVLIRLLREPLTPEMP